MHFHVHSEKNDHSLEVGKDDETNKEGHDGQAVTHHGHVVETECHLQEEKGGSSEFTFRKVKRSGRSDCATLRFSLVEAVH